MQVPLQITFRNFDASEAVEARVREEVAKLERLNSGITSCRVVLEEPHRHHTKGNLFHTSVYLELPGKVIDVTREPPAHQEHEDMYLSIRDAFREAAKQMEEHSKRRVDKAHRAEPPHRR